MPNPDGVSLTQTTEDAVAEPPNGHQAWLAEVVASAPLGIMALDDDLHSRYLNRQCAQIFDGSIESLTGRGWLSRVDPRDAEALAEVTLHLDADSTTVVPLRLTVSAGECRQISATCSRNHGGDLVAWIEDVTRGRDLEERLAHQASHDALTGLPNRRILTERIGELLANRRRRADAPGVLLFV